MDGAAQHEPVVQSHAQEGRCWHWRGFTGACLPDVEGGGQALALVSPCLPPFSTARAGQRGRRAVCDTSLHLAPFPFLRSLPTSFCVCKGLDNVAIMKPVTKFAEEIPCTDAISEVGGWL